MTLSVAGTSLGQADVGTFFGEYTEVNQINGTECVSGLTGTETITFTDSGRFVATETGFHVDGTETLVTRMEFTNGYYLTGSGRSQFAFDTTATSGQTVITSTALETHIVYNAAGEPVARVMFHPVSHIAYRDLNGNGQPDEGEIAASLDRFFYTCS